MSLRSLEAAILRELRTVTGIAKLRQKDITEWSTSDVKPDEGELLARLPELGINVAYIEPGKKKKS